MDLSLLVLTESSVFHKMMKAKCSGTELVRLIVAHFPGFRDEAVFQGRQVDDPYVR